MFKRIKTKAAVAVIAGVTLMGGTAAYASHEFTDVPDTNGFHNSISFMKQRGITTGCNTAGTLYCPQDNVTRAQMAAFLERQARVLSPRVVGVTSGTTLTPGVQAGACETSDYSLETWSEWIEVTGAWSMYLTPAEPNTVPVKAVLQYSTDSGATWIGFHAAHGDQIAPDTEGSGALYSSRSNADASNGGMTGTIRFRIGLTAFSSANISASCEIGATMSHRYSNPTSGALGGAGNGLALGDTPGTR